MSHVLTQINTAGGLTPGHLFIRVPGVMLNDLAHQEPGDSTPSVSDPVLRTEPPKPGFVARYPLPRIVIKLTHLHEAWVVGSAADPSKNPAECRDIDVLVPFAHWPAVALHIPGDAKPTMFGGWKFTSDGREIDIWPGDLAWLMTNAKAQWAWQPKHGIRLQKTLA
jgi:hypothetical protein